MPDYLHCFDYSDKLKCCNLCSRKVLESLFAMQLLINDKKQNPRSIEIEHLKNCRPIDIDGMSSPRMIIVYKASINRSLKRPLTTQEEIIVKKADLEIEFERRRREIAYAAPSRLSCLYLVENTIEGRLLLQSMFSGFFNNPKVIDVDILNSMAIHRCDPRWLDRWYEHNNDEFIVNYWGGTSMNENNPKWEYLLEGTIIMSNFTEKIEIEDHVRINFQPEYQAILIDRQNNRL